MRVLVVSDIHANLPALEAVLAAAGPVDATWCLGDLVGYGPYPNECVERIRDIPNLTCLLGNHDAAALGYIGIDNFNLDARASMVWSQNTLSEASKQYLAQLPEQVVKERVTLAHGSPRNPVWEYILESRTATSNFDYFTTDYCLVGHTHLPILYMDPNGTGHARPILAADRENNRVTPRMILNPGSVGQPRDRDSRASFAIFDLAEDRWDHYRVEYNVAGVQQQIIALGLPVRHAIRLSEGW